MTGSNQARLVEGPVAATLTRLAIPMVFGVLGIALFNLVDTFFVGRLGAAELAAMSFTFPVVMIVGSFAMGLGVGASAVVSKAIGSGDTDRVRRLTTDTLVLSLVVSTVLAVVGLVTIDPLFTFLGAPPDVLVLISEYMTIWYVGVFVVMVPMVSNSVIRATGDTKTPSLVMMVAAGVNIALDPLLILGLGPFPRLELAGAALTTVIARLITLAVSLFVIHYRERLLTFTAPRLADVVRSWKQVLYVGSPVAAANSLVPVATAVVMRLIAGFGPAAVAAWGVATRVEGFGMMAIMALTSALGPFFGQNWGAREYQRAELSASYSARFSMAWGLVLAALLALFGRPIAGVFTDNPDVISIAATYFLIVPVTYGLAGVVRVVGTVLPVVNKPLHAAALTLLQSFVFYLPLAYLGAEYFDIEGIFTAVAAAFALTGIASWLWIRRLLPELMQYDYLEQIVITEQLGERAASLGYWVSQLEQHARRYIDTKLTAFELDRSTLALLTVLFHSDGQTIEELSQRLEAHHDVARRHIGTLTNIGYVTVDGATVYVTDKARDAAPELRSLLRSWSQTLSEGFTEKETQSAVTTLRIMNENAKTAVASLKPDLPSPLRIGAAPPPLAEHTAL